MKLLFDANLSPRLVTRLRDVYPDSIHVRDAGLECATDHAVWDYAVEHAFAIIAKDADFHQRSLVFGFPPKVVWVRLGNCNTDDVEELLRHRSADIRRFLADDDAAFLALG